MASFNKIIVVGYLVRAPELRFTPAGNPVCSFNIASTEKQGDKEYTTWFKVAVWGRLAEICNERLRKGDQVFVDGRLRHETYTRRDGEPGCTLTLQAQKVEFIVLRARPEEDGQRASDEGERSSPTRPSPGGESRQRSFEEEDDIPF
jgi:single-strand DNA-binding protein